MNGDEYKFLVLVVEAEIKNEVILVSGVSSQSNVGD